MHPLIPIDDMEEDVLDFELNLKELEECTQLTQNFFEGV